MKKRYWISLVVLLAVPTSIYLSLKLPVFGAHPTSDDRLRYASSSAFNQSVGTFENRRPELMKTMRAQTSTWAMLQEWFEERDDTRPHSKLPEHIPDMSEFVTVGNHTKLIWLGHSSFLLNIAGSIILVDPVFAGYAAPVSFNVKVLVCA